MARDFGTLQINRLIVHDIPVRSSASTADPVLSETDSALTPDLRNYFREKITKSMVAAASDVIFDAEIDSPVSAIVSGCLVTEEMGFIAASWELAGHLHKSQTGINPAGLLIVVEATIDDKNAIIVLKLEREDGVRVQQQEIAGKKTFSVEHIRDLMFTGKTKVFKAAVFVQDGTAFESVTISVSDKQNGAKRGSEIADFFLKRFLGCKLSEAPDVVTERFFAASQTFINENVADPENKAKYQIALMATLNNQQDAVHPWHFAEENLAVQDRDTFIHALEEKQVPTQQFPKDTAGLGPMLKKLQMNFQSGLVLVASPQAYEDHVKISELEDGNSHVEITDRLKNVRSRR